MQPMGMGTFGAVRPTESILKIRFEGLVKEELWKPNG